jgi:hypothetical protein
MTRRLIDFTEDSTLRQTIPAALSFSYVRALVEQHLGPEAAAMLSEPQVVPREGRHQWLAEVPPDASLIRLDRASPDHAAAVRRTLDEVRLRAHTVWESFNAAGNEQDRQRAVAILRAFKVPQDDEYVWLIGERPLLVGWGYEKANVVPLEPAALALTYRRSVRDAAPFARNITENGPAMLPLPIQQSPKSPLSNSEWRWLSTFLWFLFAALSLGIGGLLLPACSIHIPGTEWNWTRSAGCAAHAENPLADLIVQNRALGEALHAQQIALEARDFCPQMPGLALAPPGPNLPALPPNVDTGAPVQARLDWDTDDDLDLVVKCPSGGWISPLRQHPWEESCGDGQRDLDANYKRKKRDYPTTEHVRWHDLHAGSYRLIVWPSSTGSGNPIPFRVTLTLFGQTQTCLGRVDWDEARAEGHVAYVIDFDPARPLPACNISSTAEGYLQLCTSGCGKE